MLSSFVFIWFILGYQLSEEPAFLLFPNLVLAFFAFLFFFPSKKLPIEDMPTDLERFDERDMMFARAKYKPGTDRYDEYPIKFLNKYLNCQFTIKS